ncbi:MAG: beta-lactamase family protein [Sphingomonas sp.]|uniref:serine hydrolase domain-containing protein n=1 Tax=Sphingomonas sp. TaxID=28214 RepID=UPI0026171119|nr:serine hydrolase domain-containing protein [Sphingomonas sp.]MDK2768123.1 beta-lactamase family protein [Sphingomonas sp.]
MSRKARYFACAFFAVGSAAFAATYSFPTAVAPSGSVFVPASAPAKTAALPPAPPKSQASTLSAPDFSAVDAAFQASQIVNGTLIIGTADGVIHEYTKGNFQPDKAYPIASSSKWLTATLLVRMAQAGKLSLGDHPYPKLSYWTSSAGDPRSQVTLGQTLSMTSGFNATPLDITCVNNGLVTLQACAQTIYNGGIDTAPGSTFSYGPEHPQIAAAIAEAAGGKSFNQLFAEYVTTPLGMGCTRFVESITSVLLHTTGRACNYAYAANANTWAAGGAVSSARDYAKLLHAFMGTSFITDMDGFLAPRTLTLQRGFIPGSVASSDWHYALGSWNECDSTSWNSICAADKINSAAGAYGWMPWIDRKNGYFALIATRIVVGSGDATSVPVEQQLQPLIVAALQP